MSGDGALRLRPHHGLCIRHFKGKGYSEAFVENMKKVIEALRADPSREIVLQEGADVLCACCPHNRSGICEAQEKVAGYDAACLAACGLRGGQRLTWESFQRLIAARLAGQKGLERVCRGCQWLPDCLEAETAP